MREGVLGNRVTIASLGVFSLIAILLNLEWRLELEE